MQRAELPRGLLLLCGWTIIHPADALLECTGCPDARGCIVRRFPLRTLRLAPAQALDRASVSHTSQLKYLRVISFASCFD